MSEYIIEIKFKFISLNALQLNDTMEASDILTTSLMDYITKDSNILSSSLYPFYLLLYLSSLIILQNYGKAWPSIFISVSRPPSLYHISVSVRPLLSPLFISLSLLLPISPSHISANGFRSMLKLMGSSTLELIFWNWFQTHPKTNLVVNPN